VRQEIYWKKKVPDNALEHFSVAVRSNPEVVLAFVRKNGLCLQRATMELRGQEQIVRAACAEDAHSIFYCSSDTTKRLLGADRAFMSHVLSKVWPSFLRSKGMVIENYKPLYQMLSRELTLDRELVRIANKNGNISMPNDLPPSLVNDREFWLEMIRTNSSFWHDLPTEFQDDLDFVGAIKNFEKTETVEDVFGRFPFLTDDRALWSKIIGSDGEDSDFPHDLDCVIRDFAPLPIRQDRELMLRAVICKGYVLNHLPANLQEDREFVEAVVENYPDPLAAMPANSQRLFPDLVVASLREGADYEVSDLIEDVTPELWLNLTVWKKYFEEGGWSFEHCPDALKDDEEFGLLAAEHVVTHEYGGFSGALESVTSVALRSNKSFMMKAVLINADHFLCACGELRRDFDLAVTAFSCKNKARQIVDHCLNDFEDLEEVNFLRRVLSDASEKINAHEGFVAGLLFGMSGFAGPDCRLALLARDMETSVALKRTVASYLGIPLSKDVPTLRGAVSNLGGVVYDEQLWTA
jgi:hypothetical protein